MATRIDIELTSRRDDATFTWRAAGAREPRGVADASLFPADAAVGAEYKVDAEFELEGITVTAVIPEKAAKPDPFQTLELVSKEDEPLVTQQLARTSRKDDRGRGKGRRRDGDRRDGDRRGGDRRGGERRGGGEARDRDRGPQRPPKPKLPPKPKPPRLKAGRAHRNALLDGLAEEQKPIAQELIGGGMQAVRNALAKQNDQRKTEGQSPIDEGPILSLAESLFAKVRVAEWRDRAEAALEQAEQVDLRDLRSVVTAAENTAKDDESRSLAASLRTALNERLDAEQQAWIDEIVTLLDDERVVRALHLSSRPPKAGAPLPASVAMRLVTATNAALSKDVSAERWGYTIEALAHAPIRRQVVPESLPATVTDELKAMIARFGTRLPEMAEIFGIEPDPSAGRAERRRRKKPKPTKGGAGKDTKVNESPETSEKSDGDQANAERTPYEDSPTADLRAAASVEPAVEPAPEVADVQAAETVEEPTDPSTAEAPNDPADSTEAAPSDDTPSRPAD